MIHIIESCVYSDLLPPGGQRHSKGVFLCKALIGSDWEVTGALHHQTWINLSYINLCREKRSFKVYQNERDSENERGKKLCSVQNPHENLVP